MNGQARRACASLILSTHHNPRLRSKIMPGHRRNPSFGDAANLHQPTWVGQPDDDEDEDEIKRAANRASAIGTTAWFIMTSGVMLAMLLVSGSGPLGFWSTSAMPTGWDAPWWLTAIFAAEAYASFRRLFLKWKLGRSSVDILGQRKLAELASQRQRRLRHFTSMRLASSAPVDLIVAKFLELDELAAVSEPSASHSARADLTTHGRHGQTSSRTAG